MSACCGYSFICFLEEGIQVWLFSLRKNRISLCTKCFLQIPEAGIQHQEKQQTTFRGNFKILLLALKIKVNFVLKTTYQIKILMQVLFTSKKKKKNVGSFLVIHTQLSDHFTSSVLVCYFLPSPTPTCKGYKNKEMYSSSVTMSFFRYQKHHIIPIISKVSSTKHTPQNMS